MTEPSELNESSERYVGPERRRRKVYVTQNTEYHCRDGVCVAVREVRTGIFLERHPALGKKTTVAVRMRNGGIESMSPAESAHPGERVHFAVDSDDHDDVLTSALRAVERPAREVVAVYEKDSP